MTIDAIKQESKQIFDEWIASCTRGGKVSRNTVAIGIVVLDHLRRNCPVSKSNVISYLNRGFRRLKYHRISNG